MKIFFKSFAERSLEQEPANRIAAISSGNSAKELFWFSSETEKVQSGISDAQYTHSHFSFIHLALEKIRDGMFQTRSADREQVVLMVYDGVDRTDEESITTFNSLVPEILGRGVHIVAVGIQTKTDNDNQLEHLVEELSLIQIHQVGQSNSFSF